MEQAPKAEKSTLEAVDAPYKAEREAGFNRAQTVIENIEGYNSMDYREQFSALNDLLQAASDRFEEEYIAAHMYEIEMKEEQAKINGDLAKMRLHFHKEAA